MWVFQVVLVAGPNAQPCTCVLTAASYVRSDVAWNFPLCKINQILSFQIRDAQPVLNLFEFYQSNKSQTKINLLDNLQKVIL